MLTHKDYRVAQHTGVQVAKYSQVLDINQKLNAMLVINNYIIFNKGLNKTKQRNKKTAEQCVIVSARAEMATSSIL